VARPRGTVPREPERSSSSPRRPVPPVRQMKGLTDPLRDLSEPVADHTLVLNLLRGLSPRYGHLKALIKRTVPFPTFHAVRNELLLEELIMAHEAPHRPRHSTTPPPVSRRLPGDRPPALRLPGPPLAPLPQPPDTPPPPPATVALARAVVGVAAPHAAIPPVGAAAKTVRPSTTPGSAPSPCVRVRLSVRLALWLRHRLS
jgi:hypothetical protein